MGKEKRTKLIDNGWKQILKLCSNKKNTTIRILLCKSSSKKFITKLTKGMHNTKNQLPM